MITNKQKMQFCVLGFVAALLAVFALLPFEILFNRVGIKLDNVKSLELIVKFAVMPLIVFIISLFSMRVRNDNYYTQVDVSITSIRMSYIPLAMYVSGLIGWLGECIYSSIPYAQDILALICLMSLWGGSIFIIVLFGVFNGWLYKLDAKKVLTINILFSIFSVLLIFGSFLVYKKIPEVGSIDENNAFLTMLLYVCLYFVMLLFLWKAIYSDQKTPVVLAKDEKFTEEEEEIIIVSVVEEEIQTKFDDYYDNNRGSFIEKILLEEENESESIDEQTEEGEQDEK